MNRSKVLLVLGVFVLHALAITALQLGLARPARFAEPAITPLTLILETAAPPRALVPLQAVADQPAAPPKSRPQTSTRPAPQTPRARVATSAPQPLAAAAPPFVSKPLPPAAPEAPAALATTTVPAAGDASSAIAADSGAAVSGSSGVSASTAAAAPAPPSPVRLDLPSSSADYLRNPKPRYPRLSLSRNEQGTVLLRVRIGPDGDVREVSLKSSSGYALLDRAARDAVLDWTFVPGRRNGVPVEMSVDVPIPFRLTD